MQNILKNLGYDIVRYDAGDVRTKSVIEKMSGDFIGNRSVISLLSKKPKKIAIVMDEIDGINNGDKGGIEAIIKLVRPKKTKKQRAEGKTPNPIICIGNCYVDKKIQKLKEVCRLVYLESPDSDKMRQISHRLHPIFSEDEHNNVVEYVQGDLRKMAFIYNTYISTARKLSHDFFITKVKTYDTRQIVHNLINTPTQLSTHSTFMNVGDRCSTGLLWHENIIDAITHRCKNKNKSVVLEQYVPILNDICFADCLDKWKMQYQIWQFDEIKSIIGTFKGAHYYHTSQTPNNTNLLSSPIRFTKILTKFANEFGNKNFIYLTCCQNFCGDLMDLCAFLLHTRVEVNTNDNLMQHICKTYNLKSTELNRMYRFLDKYTQPFSSIERDVIVINTFSLTEDNDD